MSNVGAIYWSPHTEGWEIKDMTESPPQSTALTAPLKGSYAECVVCRKPLLEKWDRLRWSGGTELCNKLDDIFIKNGIFEDVFINENLFDKKYNIIRRNSNENE